MTRGEIVDLLSPDLGCTDCISRALDRLADRGTLAVTTGGCQTYALSETTCTNHNKQSVYEDGCGRTSS